MKTIPTMWPIVNGVMANDSSVCIFISQKSHYEFFVKMYDLETHDVVFEEKVGGRPEQYIKIKFVVQNSDCTRFATSFMDDGKFYIRVFSKAQRDEQTILRDDFDVNYALGIDNNVMPNDRFYDPYITIEFITDD